MTGGALNKKIKKKSEIISRKPCEKFYYMLSYKAGKYSFLNKQK